MGARITLRFEYSKRIVTAHCFPEHWRSPFLLASPHQSPHCGVPMAQISGALAEPTAHVSLNTVDRQHRDDARWTLWAERYAVSAQRTHSRLRAAASGVLIGGLLAAACMLAFG